MVTRVWAVAIASILIVQIVVFGITIDSFPNAKAQDVPEELKTPGRVEGTGTHFEVTDSQYLNVTLDSSEPITLMLESVPEMITMFIESNSTASSTIITLSGFSSNTTFHKYQDDYHNHVSFTTDANGSYTWIQGISVKHFVFIQPRESTKFIVDNATGGDCTLIGTWNPANKTCKMTTNVSETIQIDSNGITLDGNGKFITGTDTGNGVFLPSKTGVTVKNLNVDRFSAGIHLSSSSSNTITGNSVSRTGFGIFVFSSSNSNTITSNSVSDIGLNGMVVFASNGNTITGNTVSTTGSSQFGAGIIVQSASGNTVSSNSFSNTNVGIALASSSNSNTITGNTVSNHIVGINLFSSHGNTITGNTVSNNRSIGISSSSSTSNIITGNTVSNNVSTGIFLRSSSNSNRIYNNNFIDNPTQARVDASSGNIFNVVAPTGGNYWNNFDTLAEGCNNLNGDSFCDAPFIFTGGQDNFPWTTRDGWKALPSISINDVSVIEGNSGTTNAMFTVSLSAPSLKNVEVGFAIVDGTATFPSDYITIAGGGGTLVFAPGEVSKTISITVNGDLLHEPDETFLLNLMNPTNAVIADGQGVGTIVNDDPRPSISINDVTLTEGNAGTTNAVFTVALSNPSSQTITVGFATADGTATFSSDYFTASGTLVFLPGEVSKTISITVNGDLLHEPDETFFSNLFNCLNCTIGDSQGVGTIINDDPIPSASINDVTVTEGNSGTTSAVFTVALSNPSSQTIMVNFATEDGTATFSSDYFTASGTLVFNPGHVSKFISVAVNGDINVELDENFFVNLMNPVNAMIDDAQGIGTIINDDFPPTADAKGPYPGKEGEGIALDASGSTDPDGTITMYEWDLDNDGQYDDATGKMTSVVFDDNGLYTIGLRVTDDDGLTATDTAQVTVNNVSPIVSAGADATILEGDTFSSGGSFTDPGVDTWTATVDYGDGSGIQALALNPDKTFSLSHMYADDGLYTVAVKVTDDDNGAGTDTAQVTVLNVPPTVEAGSPLTGSEGSPVSLDGASFSDPAGTLDAPYMITIDWGDGSIDSLPANSPGPISATHTYGDNANPYSIKISVKDKDGDTGFDVTTASIANLPPPVDAISATMDPMQVNTPITATATFTDPGTADTHTAVMDWGDGTTSPAPVTEADGSGTATGGHTYTVAGVYTLTLTVCDDDDGCGQSIFQFVVIYDPNGGFVTGGGWIDSPFGAYTAIPTLTGKATFGFVSKYLPGATTPSGNTEFQFKVANLNFHSHDYEWLVVAGAKAQYKGTGTINGAGNYGFMLTAIDAGVNDNDSHTMDMFRIKIWDNNGLVYDNQSGASDDSEPTTEIKGGSIVIHKEKNT